MSTTKPFLALLGAVLVLLASALTFGAMMPSPRLSQTVPIDPANLTLPPDGTGVAQRYPQDLAVRVDVPVQIVLGRTETATVELRSADLEPSIAGTPRDATLSYHPVLVAGLSSSVVAVQPDGEEGQSLIADKPVRFTWSLVGSEPGAGDVTLLVRLRFYPNAGGQPVEGVVLARTVEVTAVSVLGMSVAVARIVAAGGLAAGVGLLLAFGRQAVAWLRP